MNFFYVISGKQFKRISFIICAIILCVYMIGSMQNPATFAFRSMTNSKAFYTGDIGDKKVSLTFDIPWGESKVAPIIEILKKERIHGATFFVSGSWAERHPDLLKLIIDSGYEIGSLGYGYRAYTKLTRVEMARDLRRAEEILERYGVEKIELFRPPMGVYNQNTLDVASQFNYTVVHWSVDSKDWTNPGVKEITNNVTAGLEQGDVVYFHASDSAFQTQKALPLTIHNLRAKGYVCVTVSDLLTNVDSKVEEIR